MKSGVTQLTSLRDSRGGSQQSHCLGLVQQDVDQMQIEARGNPMYLFWHQDE